MHRVESITNTNYYDLTSIPVFQESPITIVPAYLFGNCNQVTCNTYHPAYLSALRAKVKDPSSFPLERLDAETRVKKEEEIDWIHGLNYVETTYLQQEQFLTNPSKAFHVEDLMKINGLFSRLCNDAPGECRTRPIRWLKTPNLSLSESVIINFFEPFLFKAEGFGEQWFSSLSDPLASPPKEPGIKLQDLRKVLKDYKENSHALQAVTQKDREWLAKERIDPSIVDEWAEQYCVEGKFSFIRWLQDRQHYFPEPSKIKQELQKSLDSIAEPTMHPIEKACRLWFDFVRIHPSHEANKRTGKALGSAILLASGYLPPKIGKEDTTEYVKALEEGFEKIDGCAHFTQFIARKILETQNEYAGRSINEI